ncbi:MAG: 2-oxo-4-hydroxy-4-carboxy-5-ureidoimidazoline decarboxylase [Rhodocyclaceae bacterium]
MTAESTREQAGARLDACTPEEFAQLQSLNSAYNARFGFPFILAVRGFDRRQIIERFSQRLANEPEIEFVEALRQIERIATLRLTDLVQ